MGQPTSGSVNYMDPASESSLYRNSKVLIKRDQDGSDAGVMGVNTTQQRVMIRDGRSSNLSCEINGFELVSAPLPDPSLDFFNHDEVVRKYYPVCASLVGDVTDGRAFAFDHNIRSAEGKSANRRIKGGQTVQGPAKMIHGDYTLTSAPQRLRDLSQPPKLNDTLASVLVSCLMNSLNYDAPRKFCG